MGMADTHKSTHFCYTDVKQRMDVEYYITFTEFNPLNASASLACKITTLDSNNDFPIYAVAPTFYRTKITP